MNRTYQIFSFGCKTSQSDALGYAGLLQQAGWKEKAASENPSLLVLQTCTVTIAADSQARQLARKLKREHPQAKILMTGCYAQRIEKEIQMLPEVDYVIGNLNPRKLEMLSEIAGNSFSGAFSDFPMPAESPRTRAYIKIQEGCDARCSYCIIPSVRGKSRSLPVDEVLRRVEYFRDLGYKEMIFTGISMGGYGKDLVPKSSLSALMRKVEDLPGNFRIRLSSVEPEEVTDEFVDIFTAASRFQPHLHLPLQSASNNVLKKMRRQYLFAHFDSIVNRISKRIPDLNLGTDLLVGFPEEDDATFQETYRYVSAAPFAYCHVFPFSPRPETPAAAYPRQSSHSTVTERARALRELSAAKNSAYRSKFKNRPLRSLVLAGGSEALTDNYIRVNLRENFRSNRIVYIKIDSVEAKRTWGSVVN
ncbi:MAG TPA: tRNA (N(6)-L-threonylcarbamoyladenosine(37)-C(2))-methylthiotransferase MtaB [Acidobacteriota bacterium]